MSPFIRRALVALLVVSFLGTVLALVYGRRLAGVRSTGDDSYARGALGTEALFKLLGRLGRHPTRRHDGRALGGGPLLLVAPGPTAPGAPPGLASLGEFLAARHREGALTVIALPKWSAPTGAMFVEAAAQEDAQAVLSAAFPRGVTVQRPANMAPDAWGSTLAEGEGVSLRVEVPSLQTMEVEGGAPVDVLLRTATGALVVASRDGRRVVLADPDVLSNFALHRAEHASLALHLLGEEGDAVTLDEVFHGHGAQKSLGDAMGTFPNVLLTLHATLTALLVALLGLARFGPPLRGGRGGAAPHPLRGVENAAEVLALAAGARAGLALRYVDGALRELSHRLGVRAQGPLERARAIDAQLARMGTVPAAVALRGRASGLLSSADPHAKPALRLVRDAHRLLRAHSRPRPVAADSSEVTPPSPPPA